MITYLLKVNHLAKPVPASTKATKRLRLTKEVLNILGLMLFRYFTADLVPMSLIQHKTCLYDAKLTLLLCAFVYSFTYQFSSANNTP